MFKLKSLNKKGFGHVEMIVFAVVILAIGGIGYFALRSSGASAGPNQYCYFKDTKWWGNTNRELVLQSVSGKSVYKAWITWGDGKTYNFESYRLEVTKPKTAVDIMGLHTYEKVVHDTSRKVTLHGNCKSNNNTIITISQTRTLTQPATGTIKGGNR